MSLPLVALGIVVVAQALDELRGRAVRRRRGRRGGEHRRGSAGVHERLGDLLDARRLGDVGLEVLEARVGGRLLELLALRLRLLLDLVDLLVEAGLDLRLGLGLRLGGRGALRLELARDLRLFVGRLLVRLVLLVLLLGRELVEVRLVGSGRLLGQVDADQQRPVGPRPEAGREAVERPPRVGALRQRAVVLLAQVEAEGGQRERRQHDDRDDRRTATGGARRTRPSASSRGDGRRPWPAATGSAGGRSGPRRSPAPPAAA